MALYLCKPVSGNDELYSECKDKVLKNSYTRIDPASTGRLTILDGGYYTDTSNRFIYFYTKIREIQDLYTYDNYVGQWSLLFKNGLASNMLITNSGQIAGIFGIKGLDDNVFPLPTQPDDNNNFHVDIMIASKPNQTTVDGKAYYITNGMEYEIYGKIALKNS